MVIPTPTQLLLIDAEVTAAGGIGRPALVPRLDGIPHCAYHTPLSHIAPLCHQTRALFGPANTLIAGFQLFHPATRDRADLTDRPVATTPYGDGTNFACLDLMPLCDAMALLERELDVP